MTLVKVEGVTGTIAKVASVDEGAAGMLLRIALYEALCDEVDRVREPFEADLLRYVSKTAQRARQLVPAGSVVDEALGELSKADTVFVPDNKGTRWYDGRRRGRFARADENGNPKMKEDGSGIDYVSGKTKIGPMQEGTIHGRVADMLGAATTPPNEKLKNKGTEFWDKATESKYSRLGMLGTALTHAPEPHAQMAGTALRMAAALGPEAQQVLEPGIRRTAYRYRGTERRPDRELQRKVATIGRLAAGESGLDPKSSTLAEITGSMSATRPGGGPATSRISPEAGALRPHLNGKGSPDQRRLRAQADYLALHLRDQVPNMEDARLSLEAGKMPPSIGIMVDRDGHVVSEAMGFNGDHYLPFDLKNLGRLNGGHYVRTRTTGGLTDEDVYTGLLTGARQVTVVSNSGVFTLEFDPALRGGRRHSDKSRAMVDRYARLIAAVGSGEVESNPIPKEVKAELLRQAKTGTNNPELQQSRYEQALQVEQMRARFEEPDESEIDARAEQMANEEWSRGQGGNKPTTSNQTRARTKEELKRQLRAEFKGQQQRMYRLDGDGYDAAQKALKTEFPFFVRDVRYEPLGDFLVDRAQLDPGEARPVRPGVDIGATRQRGLKAVKAKETGWEKAKPAAFGAGRKRTQSTDPQSSAGLEDGPRRKPEREGQKDEAQAPAPALKDAVAGSSAKIVLDFQRAMNKPYLAALAHPSLDPDPDWTDEQARGIGGARYVKHMVAKYQGAKLAQHLMTKASAEDLDAFKLGMQEIQAEAALQNSPERFGSDEEYDGLYEVLDAVSTVRQPFADPLHEDPTRQPVMSDKPANFGLDEKVGTDRARFQQELAQISNDPDFQQLPNLVAQYRDQLEAGDLEAVKADITETLDEYERFHAYGSDPNGVANFAQHGLQDSDYPDAVLVAQEAERHPRYKQLQLKQVAWALAHWARTVKTVTGTDLLAGGADPFAPAPQPGRPEPTAKRFTPSQPSSRRVSVHKSGSPLARQLEARLRRSSRL